MGPLDNLQDGIPLESKLVVTDSDRVVHNISATFD